MRTSKMGGHGLKVHMPQRCFVDTVTFALSVPVFGHGPSRAARASREIVAKHGDSDQRIANDPAHRPAVKSRSFLTLRPPELSGRDAEHLTEVTRQVALVGKPHGKRNLK
jgi:hypothetical protein